MSFFQNSAITPSFNVDFLHEKLSQKSEDRYLMDMAFGLQKFGHQVRIVTNQYVVADPITEAKRPILQLIPIIRSGSWIPNTILGFFRPQLTVLKAIWLALRMVLSPPRPIADILIMDNNPMTLFLLSFLRQHHQYRLVYVHHLKQIQEAQEFYDGMRIIPDFIGAKAIVGADCVVVQSKCLADVFQGSHPNFSNPLKILPPCVDTGLWAEDSLDIKRIVPDLQDNSFVFVAFGTYRKRTNFRLLLDSIEHLLSFVDEELRHRIHLVIAGHCSPRSFEQMLFYKELVQFSLPKPYASQITLLKQLPTLYQKTLIERSVALLHPTPEDPFPGAILAAMRLGKPIISTNSGFSEEVLVNRISGLLVEPEPFRFAVAMHRLIQKHSLRQFVGNMARGAFQEHFCFDAFSRKLDGMVAELTEQNLEG